MLWDNHMHSSFSGDSKASPVDMINSAKEKGLTGITFTDHLDIDYREEPGLFDLDTDTYFSVLQKLAVEYSDENFTILTGIELGLQPHICEQNQKIANSYDFDFIIGSTHVVGKADPYYPSFWKNKDIFKLCTKYYEEILKNITVFSDFDALGHLDYMFRYAPDMSVKSNPYEPYKEIIDEIFKTLIKKDKALEINTSKIHSDFPEPNPCIQSIKRYSELGGKLITLGADAHTKENIALGFDTLPDLLKTCGFDEFAVYQKRKPIFFKL